MEGDLVSAPPPPPTFLSPRLRKILLLICRRRLEMCCFKREAERGSLVGTPSAPASSSFPGHPCRR